MKILNILLIIVLLSGIFALLYFVLFNKISHFFGKTSYAKEDIESSLNNKYKLLIKINNQIKKTLHAKKDYLTNINNIDSTSMNLQNYDKKLTEYTNTLNNLINDYTKLSSNKDVKKLNNSLIDLDEKLDASKTYFNRNMNEIVQLNQKFYNKIIIKLSGLKIEEYFQINEVIKKIDDDNL